MQFMEKVKVSIITVTYNCKNDIEDTIKSILMQDYPNIEYIIIDGFSTDGTIEVIKKYTNRISLFISEPDNGLYDAMNKGVSLATGNWCTFMNAGDLYDNKNIISHIFKDIDLNTNKKVIYGNTEYVRPDGSVYLHPTSTIENLKWTINRYQPYTHQAVFYNINRKEDCYYDLCYKISADYDVACRYWNKYGLACYYYIPLVVCKYKAFDGISSDPSNLSKLYKEVITLKIKNHMNFIEIIKDCWRYLKCILK